MTNGQLASAARARRLALRASSIYAAANGWRLASSIAEFGISGRQAQRTDRAPQTRGVTERRRREGAPLVLYTTSFFHSHNLNYSSQSSRHFIGLQFVSEWPSRRRCWSARRVAALVGWPVQAVSAGWSSSVTSCSLWGPPDALTRTSTDQRSFAVYGRKNWNHVSSIARTKRSLHSGATCSNTKLA